MRWRNPPLHKVSLTQPCGCTVLLVSTTDSTDSLHLSPTDSLEDSAEYAELHDVTDLTKHCILFAASALAPKGLKLPATGTHRIEAFCQTMLQEVERLDTVSYTSTKRCVYLLVSASVIDQIRPYSMV